MSAFVMSEITRDLKFAYEKGINLELSINIDNDPVIVFSDQHRGNGGSSDDYRNCDDTYRKALNYYLDKGYRLILLGDVEELWENNTFASIHETYNKTYNLEKIFFDKNLDNEEKPFYIRCYGNHDYKYAFPDFVNDDLGVIAKMTGVKVYEGIKMKLTRNETLLTEMYLSHGHQGHYPRSKKTMSSIVVAAFGKIQNRTGTPTNKSIRKEPPLLKRMRRLTNAGYLKWAHRNKMPVVYGHTHEAVFNSKKVFNGKRITIPGIGEPSITTPNAFNPGCCSFFNGEISGIEISEGAIKLVLWTSDAEEPTIVEYANGEKCTVSIETLVANIKGE